MWMFEVRNYGQKVAFMWSAIFNLLFYYMIVFVYMVSLTIWFFSQTTGFITCDDECTSVFADGCPLVLDKATYNNWTVATKIIIPSGTKVVAIHAKDHGGPEGILGSFSNGQVTDATWKCHSSPVPSEWASADFDDSSWQVAVEYPWSNKIQNITDHAKGIWSKDKTNKSSEVYCRMKLLGPQWSSLPSQSVQSTKTCPHSNPHMTPITTSAVYSGNVKAKLIYYFKTTSRWPGCRCISSLFLCIVVREYIS